jgi:isopentenyl diphosphate isomerase/L-lactate dehydrogenase-like FMN-dependent dehydrogenase
MGFGDWVSGAFNWVKDTAKNVVNDVKDGLKYVGKTVVDAAKKVDWKAVGSEVYRVAGKAVDLGISAAKTVYNDIKNVAQKPFEILSSPFTWVGIAIAGVAGIYLISKLPSNSGQMPMMIPP